VSPDRSARRRTRRSAAERAYRMSVVSRVLGIGFPAALLLVLFWTRGRGPSVPRAA